MKKLKRVIQTLVMFARIVSMLFDEQWKNLVDSVPAMVQARDQFKLMVDDINAKISRYHFITRGISEQKQTVRLALNTISLSIMSSARSWAIKNADLQMAAKLAVTPAEIKNMPYKMFLPLIERSISIIEPLVLQLADFNVTPASFLAWQQAFQTMNEIKSGPIAAIKQRNAIGKEIMNDTKAAMKFLENQITPLVANFQSSPEFFVTFYNSKKIGSPDVHHTRLVAHVTDELGNPVYAAIVRVDSFVDPNTGKTYAADSSVTNPSGDDEVTEFFAGNRSVTISGPGIETNTFPPIVFESGRAVTKTFIVRPAFTNIPAPQQAKEKVQK